jgi:hypothetical protein
VVVVLLLAACGGKKAEGDPGKLCADIYEQRTRDVAMLAEAGPEHRAQFTLHCLELPVEFLACHADESPTTNDECIEQLRDTPYRTELDSLLLTGKKTRVRPGVDE